MAKNKNHNHEIKIGVLTGLGVVLYIILIALLIFGLDSAFTEYGGGILTMIIVLMLLVISAAITGGLVLGYPAYLFINKKFKDAIYMAASSVITILIFGAISVIFMWLIS